MPHPSLPKVKTPSPLNHLMIDFADCELTAEDRELIQHPFVGSVILFTRNYQNREQLIKLCADIHNIKSEIKIAVDHEGGRVQRFREGFTIIPPMDTLGKIFNKNPEVGINTAKIMAQIMADELINVGVDFTFAPVLDINYGNNEVIGNRAFFTNADNLASLITLTHAFNEGLKQAGMPAIGKHFPGHGFVRADSHIELPIDNRTLAEIESSEIFPYIHHQQIGLDAVMMAHVIYQNIDKEPAGYSKYWINYLRQKLKFTGLIFSDDLSMQGAKIEGDNINLRAQRALLAGCDILIICNDRNSVREYLSNDV